MKKLLAFPALGPLLCALAIICLVAYCTLHVPPQAGELSRKQERAAKQAVTTNVLAARRDSAQAARAGRAAQAAYALGQAYEDSATSLSRHAQNAPRADTSAGAVRRFFADYTR